VTLHPDCQEVLRRVAEWGEAEPHSVEVARALDADGADFQARTLARASNCVVLSVDYRLAPEHPFPTPAEDAFAAVRWAATNAEALGAERDRIAVGGDSAGGNLTAAVTLMARERGGPDIAFQLLVYPTIVRDLEADSRDRYAEGYWLTTADMDWFWAQYLARDGDATHGHASPLLAESLEDLPPTMIVLAECDVLHDEGVLYARRLQQAGVPVTIRRYEGMIHGFSACARIVGDATAALADAGAAVGGALSR
jgi:acetyl esterase